MYYYFHGFGCLCTLILWFFFYIYLFHRQIKTDKNEDGKKRKKKGEVKKSFKHFVKGAKIKNLSRV